MNKKEVLELRKQFKPEDCSITRICGCYVDGEKEIKSQTKDAFLSLPEEEIFKYLNIFKQTLSGTIGKNLLQMKFLNMCFAVSVRFTFPKKDFATILRRTMSKTGFVTGLSNHR